MWLAPPQRMSSHYPVQVDVVSPPQFDRVQVVLRIGIAILLGWLGLTAGWLTCLLFGALPLVAAAVISSERDNYLGDVAPQIWIALDWLLRLSAYMLMLVDRFPSDEARSVVTEIRYNGAPTVGSALARLITSLPSGIVLMLLWCVSCVLWVAGALAVLLGLGMPSSILGFQRGVLRWHARLLAYHASFVAEYPPWSFDTETHGHGGEAAAAASGR